MAGSIVVGESEHDPAASGAVISTTSRFWDWRDWTRDIVQPDIYVPPAGLDPPTIRESIAPTSGTSASTTAAAAVGDLVIAVTLTDHTSAITHTLQGGWTQFLSSTVDFGTNEIRMTVAARTAASAGVQSYNPVSSSGGTSFTALLVLQVGTFASTWASTFLADSRTNVGDADADPEPVTATDASLVLAIAGWRWTSSVTASITPPSGYTEAVEIAGANQLELSIATKEVTAGAENPGTFTDGQTAEGWIAITVAILGAVPPIEGTAAITLGAITSSAAATLAISGAAAATLDAVTVSSASGLAISGTLAATLGTVTIASASELAIAGTSAVTLGDVAVSSASTLTISGAAAITLDAVTSTSAATLSISGAAAVTLDAVTSAAIGELAISGALASTLDAVTVASASTLAIDGALAVTLGNVTVSSEGDIVGGGLDGSLAVTLDAVTVSSAATLSITGTSATTLGAVSISSTSTLDISGTAAVTLGEVAISSASTLAIAGASAVTLGDVAVSSAATLTISGSFAVTLGPVVAGATAFNDSRAPISAAIIRAFLAGTIADLTPRIGADRRFVAYRGEGDGIFTTWAQSVPAAALRRFQVRTSVLDAQDLALDDLEGRPVSFEILIAYPQTSRMGRGASLDRDDAMASDQRAIERAIGLPAFATFNEGGDGPVCAWIGGSVSRVPGAGVDFLVIRQTVRFDRAREAA